jgi:hypothetical protein
LSAATRALTDPSPLATASASLSSCVARTGSRAMMLARSAAREARALSSSADCLRWASNVSALKVVRKLMITAA